MSKEQNISSTFTLKSDAILSDIMSKYGLEESEEEMIRKLRGGIMDNELTLTKLTMYFSRKEISKEELVGRIQKEVNVPGQKAEKIADEIINKLVPTLGKHLEYEGEKKPVPLAIANNEKITTEEKSSFRLEKTPITDDSPAPKSQKRTDWLAGTPAKRTAPIIKESLPQTKQPRGPDNYREPIE